MTCVRSHSWICHLAREFPELLPYVVFPRVMAEFWVSACKSSWIFSTPQGQLLHRVYEVMKKQLLKVKAFLNWSRSATHSLSFVRPRVKAQTQTAELHSTNFKSTWQSLMASFFRCIISFSWKVESVLIAIRIQRGPRYRNETIRGLVPLWHVHQDYCDNK